MITHNHPIDARVRKQPAATLDELRRTAWLEARAAVGPRPERASLRQQVAEQAVVLESQAERLVLLESMHARMTTLELQLAQRPFRPEETSDSSTVEASAQTLGLTGKDPAGG